MTAANPPAAAEAVPRAEHFPHAADAGVRGIGLTRDQAFEQAALALTALVTDPAAVRPERAVEISCEARDDAMLLVEWLNAVIYRMAVDRMLFARFTIRSDGQRLSATAWGEPVDRVRHAPAVEPKGATLTALKVTRGADGAWMAQCVIDV